MSNNLKLKQGERQLRRLSTLLDILYGVLIIKVLDFLPLFENMEWMNKEYGLLAPFIEQPLTLLRIFIGVGLSLLSWTQTKNLFKSLERTDGRHSTYSILQVLFVYFFIYFAIADPNLEGGPSSPALQSLCLAISGLMGILAWRHAGIHGLSDPELKEEEFDRITSKNMVEPMTATLNIILAFIGPMVWTIGWFVWPVLIIFLQRKLKSK